MGLSYFRQFVDPLKASHLTDLLDFYSFVATRAKVSIAKLIERSD